MDDVIGMSAVIIGTAPWSVGPPIQGQITVPRALLLLPIWPGFVINTMFYAAMLWGGWLLFAAPFALRKRRRIKRGLCPKCAYPVGASEVCTECGAAVASKKAVTA